MPLLLQRRVRTAEHLQGALGLGAERGVATPRRQDQLHRLQGCEVGAQPRSQLPILPAANQERQEAQAHQVASTLQRRSELRPAVPPC